MKGKLLVFLLTLVLSVPVYSQTTYRPKDQESIAKDKAISEGIEDPVLIGVGTTTGKPIDELEFELTYDAETGHATAWFYYYKSASDDNNKIVIAPVNFFGQYVSYVIPEDQLSELPPLPDIEINVDWIDSDEFGDYLFQNATAKEFFKIPKSKINIEYAALGANEGNDELIEGDIYWTIVANSQEGEEPQLTCYTHAVTGETICSIINSVNEIVADHGLYPYPNPATDRVTIPLPQDIMTIRSVKLIAADGLQTELDMQGNFATDALNFQVDQFPSGRYILTVEDEQRIFVYPLVIVR